MKGENPTRHPAGKYVTVHKEKCSPVTGEIRAITGNQVMRVSLKKKCMKHFALLTEVRGQVWS